MVGPLGFDICFRVNSRRLDSVAWSLASVDVVGSSIIFIILQILTFRTLYSSILQFYPDVS